MNEINIRDGKIIAKFEAPNTKEAPSLFLSL